MILIGLTGSLGSGKSTVGRLLHKRGAVLIDADLLVRDMQEPGRLLLGRMVREFGHGILTQAGALDRKAMAARVFSDAGALRRLNRLIHPAVRQQEAALISRFQDHPVVALDIPLLFENHLHRLMDWVVAVSVTDAARFERLKEQRGLDEAEVRRRLAAQWPDETKRAMAHFMIDNSGGMEATEAQVQHLWERLLRMNRTNCKRQHPFHNPFHPIRRGEHA